MRRPIPFPPAALLPGLLVPLLSAAACPSAAVAGDGPPCCENPVPAAPLVGPAGVSRGTLFRWSPGGEYGGPDLDAPLVTERPSFTPSLLTVGRGVAQLETGYTLTRPGDGSRSESFPEPLLRLGVLGDWLEVRGRINYREDRAAGAGSEVGGAADSGVSLKAGLTPQAGVLPATAVIAALSLPTGADAFTAGEPLPSLTAIYGWDLTDDVSVTALSRAARVADSAGDGFHTRFAQSALLGLTLTDRVSSFGEVYVLAPDGSTPDRAESYFDAGLLWRPTDDVQLDAFAGTGLNAAADDYFLGGGFSVRVR